MFNNFKNNTIYEVLDLFDFGIFWKNVDGKYLGCNRYMLNLYNLKTHEEILEKTDYHFLSTEQADKIGIIDNIVFNGKNYCEEELFIDVNNITKNYLIIKKALYNSNNKIIGLLGVLIDITFIKQRLELEKKQIILDEEAKIRQIIDVVDANIYWQDIHGHILGCNQYVLDVFEMKSRKDIIGKTEYDLLPKEEADRINAIDKFVLEHGGFKGEEIASTASGEQRVYYSAKNRMVDSQGNVIGIVGTSLDVTAQKEAEKLKAENEKHKVIEEQQEKFRKIVNQVVHDIRSPIASMQMILPSCNTLPEGKRISLNKAASRVMDIANRLLNEVKPTGYEELSENQIKVNFPTLISSEIFEVISEKKYEYKQKTIDFCAYIAQNSYFIFLNIISSDFKRMLSNLINNSVDAIKDKIGKIDLHLSVVDHKVQITLQDNGSGMPDVVREKILNNISVTVGKTDGHGIGFSQIRDTLENSQGILDIESSIGVGTKIILTFPQAETPDWIAKQIELFNDDIIVILDDDESIHGAWETRFKQCAPDVIRRHFEQGEEAITFINSLDKAEKEKVFLLTDYELLDQGLHGLHVVKQTGIARSILVTSHHNSKEVRDLAKIHNTKILPKPLAPQIPINVLTHQIVEYHQTKESQTHQQVDVVLIDDDIEFSNNFAKFITSYKKAIDKYNIVAEFMNDIMKYSKDTPILIDNEFIQEKITGIEIARQLHNIGFSQLYLFSGRDYRNDRSIPSYLTPILKTDLDYVINILNK